MLPVALSLRMRITYYDLDQTRFLSRDLGTINARMRGGRCAGGRVLSCRIVMRASSPLFLH